MNLRRHCLGALTLYFGFSLGLIEASAQLIDQYFQPPIDADQGNSSDQSKSATLSRYYAGGVRVGGFTVRPDFTESFGYNSNVQGFAGGRGSALLDTQASVNATSDWSRNNANLFISLYDRRYFNLPNQSFTNWSIGLGGALNLGRSAVGISYSHQTLTQLPGSLNAVTVSQPVPFTIDTFTLNDTIPTHGRLTFEPALSAINYGYDSYTLDGVTVSQGYRNRVALEAALTTRYEVAPERDALLVARVTRLSYTSSNTDGLPKRNSNGGAVLAGLDFPAPGSNLKFRALVGVQIRNYQSGTYKALIEPIVEASITLIPTKLTTITLSATREIEDAADDTIAGFTSTSGRLSVNYELRRNIILSGYGEVLQANYPASNLQIKSVSVQEAGTSQIIYNGGVSASWLLNREMRVVGSAGLSQHSRSSGNPSYLSNISLLTFGIRL